MNDAPISWNQSGDKFHVQSVAWYQLHACWPEGGKVSDYGNSNASLNSNWPIVEPPHSYYWLGLRVHRLRYNVNPWRSVWLRGRPWQPTYQLASHIGLHEMRLILNISKPVCCISCRYLIRLWVTLVAQGLVEAMVVPWAIIVSKRGWLKVALGLSFWSIIRNARLTIFASKWIAKSMRLFTSFVNPIAGANCHVRTRRRSVGVLFRAM